MPLLHRKPFVPAEYPFDLKEADEVFVCHSTGEIFKDYDDFCERIILCNSLVWSCSLTGRSHLTYQEAAASEEKVKRLLKRFPMELREPVLYLSSICERRSLVELAEEVFSYVKDRFFIGEPVEVEFPEGQVSCHILSVVPPTELELEALKGKKDKDDRHFPPASSYKYEVQRMDNEQEVIVEASRVSRKKSAYSKDKNRLYIKQFVHNDQGIWRLKESTNTKYGINKIKFSHIFCGDPPDMNPKKPVKQRKPSPDKMKKQGTINNYFKSSTKKIGLSPRKSPKKAEVSVSELKKARRRRRSKKEMEEDKVKLEAMKKEMRLKKKALIMQSRAKYNEFVRKWNMKREDLECEDLKELPNLHPVECESIANEHFGDVAMLMEFFSAFNRILDTKDFFPHGISFELLTRSISVKEPAGPLSDLLQLLLCRIFGLLEGELDEIKQTDLKVNPSFIPDRGDPERKKLSALAARTEMWVRKHHGVPLAQLQLDTSTISEMIRLHLLTSGSMSEKSKEAKWRYQARGGYCNSDDPGIQFRIDHPEIIEKLGSKSIFEFETGEKIEVLRCLMNQILTYSATRDIIDESCEKAKQCRIELRALRAEQSRKEREEMIRLKDLKKSGQLTAEQQADAEKNKEKEDEETKERELRSGIIGEKKSSIQKMTHELNEALRSAQMAPLGMDRAHRRYWLFPSIPGLFIEDGDQFKGSCLPKCTPSAAFNHEDSIAYIKMLFKESSNKENISDKQENILTSSPKKLLSEKNGETTPIARNRSKSETQPLLPMTCWADPENCPVHGTNVSRPMWSYIKDPNELERLIEALNKRGVRERKLRESLIDEKEKIINILQDFPIHLFSAVGEDHELDSNLKLRNHKIMKPYESSFCGYPEDSPLDEIVEGTLRDWILETEEKISAGALGYLKVKDRDAWRNAIANNSYDKQCKQLTWGSKIREEDEEIVEVEEMEVDDEDDSDSRCSTPSIEVRSSTTRSYMKGFNPVPQRQVVQDLASAIIQIEQSIEPKFLKRPLGLDQKERDRGETRIPTPAMERWEKAVMESTNFSQLFLHFSTLENSVHWARSAINAFCRICRRKQDAENMLLCDSCNKGHHMYCLKPKLTKVPSGDWFCKRCKPKEKITPAKKTRRMFSEDDSENEESDTDVTCNTCNQSGAQLVCDSCNIKLHLTCVNPPVRKVPKSKWFCHDCRTQNAASAVKKEPAEVKMEVDSPPKSDEEKPKGSKVKKEAAAVKIEKLKESLKAKVEKESLKVKNEKETAKIKVERPKTPQGRVRSERKSLVNGRDPDDDWESPNPYGYVEEVDRLSRRKCSKAATAKISLFAKQLRSSQWAENGEVDENEFRDESRSRRSRRSVETTKKPRELPLDNAALQEILEVLMHHKDAWPFLRPVTKSEVPDYHIIIKKPMDFATIKHKLNMLEYTKNSELIADANLLFDNCYLYNQEGSEVYKAGETLQKMFHKLCQDHNLLVNGDASPQEPPPKKSRTVL